MAARTNNDTGGTMAEINVIPLVDIILVVLIIFMVAAPLVMKPKIDISLPKASTAKEDKDKSPLRVMMGKKGELFLNDKPVTLEGITAESRQAYRKNPETAALLVADKEVTLEMITELVDAIKSGGVKKVAFSIERK